MTRVGTFSLEDLSEDDRRIIQTDAQYARATGEPPKWAVSFDPDGSPSIARIFDRPALGTMIGRASRS